MNEQLDKQLCEKYPRMFIERNAPMHTTCMCWGFTHGDGWYNLLDNLCSVITNHVTWARQQRALALLKNRKLKRAIAAGDPTLLYDPKYASYEWHINECVERFRTQRFEKVPDVVHHVVVQQVKEKFGTLRFYYRGGDEFVSGAVTLAENMSGQICEHCGVPGTHGQIGGWVCTLCDSCKEKEVARRKADYGYNEDDDEDTVS